MTPPVHPITKKRDKEVDHFHRQQTLGSWIFGGLLLIFYLAVFLFGADVISDQKHQMLGLISAILSGLLAFFITGTVALDSKQGGAMPLGLGFRAGGGLAAAAGILLWWRAGGPVKASSETAEQIRTGIDSSAAAQAPAPGNDSVKKVIVPSATRDLAARLANVDPAYRRVSNLLDKDSLNRAEYLTVRRTLAEIGKLELPQLPADAKLTKVEGDGSVIPLNGWKEFAVRVEDGRGTPVPNVRVAWMTPAGGQRAYVGATNNEGISKATALYTFPNPGTYRQIAVLTNADAPVGFADGTTIGVIGSPVVFTYQQR